MTRVLYEAENFNKPGGTGIKTYVENLAQAARAIGFHTEALLFAPRPLNKRDPLLAEVAFFDARRKASTLDQFLRIPAR
jgi:hypothetical protein